MGNNPTQNYIDSLEGEIESLKAEIEKRDELLKDTMKALGMPIDDECMSDLPIIAGSIMEDYTNLSYPKVSSPTMEIKIKEAQDE